jgi:hypothetical protein
MQVRLRPCNFGDRVTVKNCEIYFYLPDGLPDHSEAVVVGHQSGRVIVEALGKQWNLPMQCVDNGADYFCNGQWLDQHDRRVRKELAREQMFKGRERLDLQRPIRKVAAR